MHEQKEHRATLNVGQQENTDQHPKYAEQVLELNLWVPYTSVMKEPLQ